MNKLTGEELHSAFWGMDGGWEAAQDKPRWERLADVVNARLNAEVEGTHVSLKVSERSVYNALRNILTHTYGLSKSSIMAEVLKVANPQAVIREWMNGQNVRDFVGRTAREVVREIAAVIIRDEVKAAINSRVKITLAEVP